MDGGEGRGEGGEAVEMEGIWRDIEEVVERASEAGREVIRGRETSAGKGLAVVICRELR